MPGIYIHIPFCRQACTYCNFHFSTTLGQKRALLDGLSKEILLTRQNDPEQGIIETIYVGGGTPSLLLAEEIEHLLQTLKQHFEISPTAEITLEANPDDVSEAVLQEWKRIGINRLSLGVQSFHEDELRWMNRAHNSAQSIKSIEDIIAAGFSNFSVDLIYGSPLLSNEDFIRNIQIVLSNNIPHVSAYALTVEPKTRLHSLINSKKTAPVDEARQAEQFDILVKMLEDSGYEQYEISNFAKPGFRSRHNSRYWQGKAYYGFGPSAHSFDGKSTRRWNISNNALYIKSIEQNNIPFEEEILTATQQLNEYIMISLRTAEGLDIKKVEREFGEKEVNGILEKSVKYLNNKKLALVNNQLILTKEGRFFADGIAADLFE
ncbi:MAG: radical SAM family heme chaperone HemW [Gloeobacteraceae cyanobacterium ES-bin-316]|nr:radical SAM family heme chaperone HemW [Ferruginibacter sp.]